MKKIFQKIKNKIAFLLFYKKNQLIKISRQELEKDIIKKLFNNNLTVRTGPFKGMGYINISFCSNLLPKILGTYESPLEEWVEEAISKNYSKIIDIGSAEGYYSVGFALKTNCSTVYAYDINKEALEANKKLAILNSTENKMVFKNLCTNEELKSIATENTLIICDIEGSEKELLDPFKTPNLLLCDLIIESHDFIDKEITEILINRFYKTHKIEIIVDYKRDINKALEYTKDVEKAKMIIDEERPEKMKWLRITKINDSVSR